MLFSVLGVIGVPSALLGQPALKIVAPADDVVVYPGKTITVEVSVSGPFSLVALEQPLIGLNQSLKAPPYFFQVTVPETIGPGRYNVNASIYAPGKVFPVAKDMVWIDIEPAGVPRKLRIEGDYDKTLQVGGGADLRVIGTLEGGRDVFLSRSTRTTYEAVPPGIVSVSKEGQVRALAPGSATIIARHQSLQADAKISVTSDALRITSPAEGTLVHTGDKLYVDVSPSGGPFEAVTAVLAPSFAASAELTVQPYWFSFAVPATMTPGPADVLAMGRNSSLLVWSDPVSINIERADAPESIFTSVNDRYGLSLSVGIAYPISVYGKYPDNPRLNLSKSSFTTYTPR